jgi:hypothetical protein
METRNFNQIEVYGIEQILKEKITQDCEYFCCNGNWFMLHDDTLIDNAQDDYYKTLHSVAITQGNDFILHVFADDMNDSIYYLSSILNLNDPDKWIIIDKPTNKNV